MAFAIEPGRGSPAGVAFRRRSWRERACVPALPEGGCVAARLVTQLLCRFAAKARISRPTARQWDAPIVPLSALLLAAMLALCGAAAAKDPVSEDFPNSPRAGAGLGAPGELQVRTLSRVAVLHLRHAGLLHHLLSVAGEGAVS